MINNTQNHLLSQMQALESLAKGQAMQPEVKSEQNQSFGDLMQQAVGNDSVPRPSWLVTMTNS